MSKIEISLKKRLSELMILIDKQNMMIEYITNEEKRLRHNARVFFMASFLLILLIIASLLTMLLYR